MQNIFQVRLAVNNDDNDRTEHFVRYMGFTRNHPLRRKMTASVNRNRRWNTL